MGAVAVAESDPNVVYAGMGDTCMRPDMASGDGVYKSTNGGKTWAHVGLEETRHIAQVRIHPSNPNLVYVAAFGHAFGPNPERGVYRSKDGGKTWQRVLFKSERAGAIDLSMDRGDPRVLYAAIYQFVRQPWDEISGGPDSGLYKSVDGGDTWTDLSKRPGFPTGIKGRIGVAMSPAKPSRVWALVEAEDGGLFRSDDSGATWQAISRQRDLRRSPSSYMHVYPHPKNPEILYILSYEAWKSTDGGKTFRTWPTTHGDNHAMWIDPNNPDRMIEGNDGGATVTLNGGNSWSGQFNQISSAVYRIAVDNQFPYRVYATQQDSSAVSVPSRTSGPAITFHDTYPTGGAESGHIAVKPDDPKVVLAGAYGSGPGGEGQMKRYDGRTGLAGGRVINIWPEDTYSSHPQKDKKFRFNWTFPLFFSPHDPDLLYAAGNYVFRSRDLGQSWEIISPDLTRNDTSVLQAVSGGPITSLGFAQTFTNVVFALAESPLRRGELWAGSDDSAMHLSRDGGRSWNDISSKDWPKWLKINTIELSRHDPATAYFAANRHQLDDQRPYVYMTTDYGKTWKSITAAIGPDDFARVIREDPVRAGLLYLGTERGVYVSFNAGESWHSLQRNLPGVAVHDLLVKDNDLVIGTHSRGLWILDDVTPLRYLTDAVARSAMHLFQVPPTYRLLGASLGRRGAGGAVPSDVISYGGEVAYKHVEGPNGEVTRLPLNAGRNPPNGVVVTYFLREKPAGDVTITIRDQADNVIRRFSSRGSSTNPGEPVVSAVVGTNRFVWDMRYPNARELSPGAALSGMEWPRPAPPAAAPGTYVVQLEAAGRTMEEPFEIRKDPRVAWSESDLAAQFTLWMAARDKVSETTDIVNRLREIRKQVDERGAGANGARKEAADRLKARLASIEGGLTRTVGANPMLLPPKGLHQQFATLTTIIGSADGAPTRWTHTVFNELSARLAGYETELKGLIATEVSEFLKSGPSPADSRD
ncbi:MAG TPA: hypothetical protein VK886_00620 [Vicinamibacterales bacterium]|nr:hypothetical protein [Vicinamibacterales bacterium]